MIQTDKEIIQNSIRDLFSLRQEVLNFEINNNFQFSIAQLELFKAISSLLIGILAIGYIYDKDLNSCFLLISFIFSLTTLVLTISYTREFIDLQTKLNEKTRTDVYKKTDEDLTICLESLKQDDFIIYYQHIKNRLQEKYKTPESNYIGEIMVFLFYSSVGFLIFAFLSSKYHIGVLSYSTVMLLIVIYFLSFKEWAFILSEKLSCSLSWK